ncbi:EamA family transporter [Hyphomonas sp.]|jgi:drug/metabolite transporter (DMT)-like permease|uniref:EamA family transporter n=1 Tax=Hyphomonas sp. TaxID=87 RepID=UPI000C45BC41|nr:EamA family transporter [Hyphomonas sp.]MAB10176.1 EamA family transporter [Hyphomonas sp.]MAU67660.1 EamA family transporter [Hyphomonas sp.]
MPVSEILPIALCLMSAITLATTNVLVKGGGDILTGRMLVQVTAALIVLPFAFVFPMPPLSTWPLLGISMVSHWFYQACLIRAMHRGDLSLVYPVMRGLGPLATAVFATFLLQEHLAPMQQIGLFCASFAILFFALPTAATREGRSLDRRALFWAVLTAVGIGLYAVSDTRAARAMPHPMTFVIILFLVDWIGVTLVFLWQRRGRYMQTIRPQLRSGVIGGIVGCLSYGMAIFAYTMTDAAMVTALRETSVVFAAIMAAVFLKESFGARRIVAASVLATGLVLMQAGAV